MKAVRARLYLIAWLTDFALVLIIFGVSRRLAEEQSGLLALGILGCGNSISALLGSVYGGRASDRFGRRRVMILGNLLLLTCGLGVRFVASGHPAYLPFYWLGGISIGFIYPPLIAWLSQDHTGHGSERGISSVLIRFCFAWNIGMIGGQVCGGWLFTVSSFWPITLAMMLCVCNLLLLLILRYPSSRPASGTNVLPSVPGGPSPARSALFARLCWIANVAGAFSISMIFYLFPALAVSLGIAPERHGVMLGTMRIFTIGTYFLMHHSRFWHYRFSTSLGAQAAAVAGLLLLVTSSTSIGLTIGLCGLGILVGYNYFAGLYYSTTGASDNRKGTTSGIHEGTLGLGMAAGTLVGGLAGTYTGIRSPYVLAICVVLALAIAQTCLYVRHSEVGKGTEA